MRKSLIIIGILVILFTSSNQPSVAEGKDIPRVGEVEVHYKSIT